MVYSWPVLLDELGTQVGQLVLKLDGFGHSDAVLGDLPKRSPSCRLLLALRLRQCWVNASAKPRYWQGCRLTPAGRPSEARSSAR